MFNWTQKDSQSPAITCQDDGENKKQVHTCELPHVKLWTLGSHTYQSFHDTGDKKGVVTKSSHMHTHTRCHRKRGSYIYMCVKSLLLPIQKTVNFVVSADNTITITSRTPVDFNIHFQTVIEHYAFQNAWHQSVSNAHPWKMISDDDSYTFLCTQICNYFWTNETNNQFWHHFPDLFMCKSI